MKMEPGDRVSWFLSPVPKKAKYMARELPVRYEVRHLPSPPSGGNVIKLSIRALILEETLLKKGFFQAIFRKLLKVFGKGFKGKNPFPKGFSP